MNRSARIGYNCYEGTLSADMTIIEELKKNPEEGARRLERECKPGLLALARRLCADEGDAEELVNRTLAEAVAHIDSLLSQSALFGWMCQILVGCHAKDTRRKSNGEIVYPGDVPDAPDSEAEESIYRDVDHSILRGAIQDLPDDDRELLLLHYFLEIPIPKMAKILAVPAGTVKSRLHYARKALAAKLGAAAKKPGAKALLIALSLAALTAAGAATSLAVVRLLSPHRAAQEQQADNSKDAAAPEQQAYNRKAAALEQQADDSDPDVSLVTRLPSLVTQETAQSASSPSFTTQPSQQETTMNATTRVFLAASAAFAAATGTPLAALADDYVVNVPLDETQTIDATLVADIGTKNLVKTGRGTLVSSADMASYTGTITIREGAFEIKTTSDLGTADGGTVVEDGGTLLVDMASGQERFSNELFTIAGTGDAAYGAAVYQATGKSNRFKLFKNLTLSGDTTVFSGTMLGVDAGNVAMNGHTLTIKGLNFTFRNDSFPAPVGNIVTEANLLFQNGSGTIGDPSKTLTVRNGGRVSIAENNMGVVWRLVVEEGGNFTGSASTPKHWGGDVVWNATTDNGVSGIVTFDGELTGTGVVKVASGALTLAKPPADTVGLSATGTASIEMPHRKAYSYEHKGMKIIRRSTLTSDLTYFSDTRTDVVRDYCAFGPGPQLDVSYWSMTGKKSWCSRGYLWNRETTDVTYTIGINCVYQNYVFVNGSQVYYKKRDGESSGSTAIRVPAGSCVPIDIVTTSDQLYGPRTEKGDGDKFKINGAVAIDPTGWYFTTNAVSGVANPAVLPSFSLADDGAIDMNGMPLSVAELSGAGLVTNVTALTVSDSWTLAAADIADEATLEVYGDVVFGNGATISVSNLRSLPVAQTFTICKADSISGIVNGTLITEQATVWKVVLSGDGTTLSIENVPQATVLYLR